MFPFIQNRRFLIATVIAGILLLLPYLAGAQAAEGAAVAENLEAHWAQKFLWEFVNVFFGWMVFAAGMLLNYGVTEAVVNFGTNFIDNGLGFAVENLWTVMRDFFNLFFIFGLVYIGFRMILRSEDTNARRLLVNIILAALLVNFSLFFTKFIVDFANIAATQVATAFPESSVEGQIGIADSFMNLLGLQGMLSSGNATGLTNLVNGGGYAYIFGSMILFIVAAFVFAAGGLLLVIRMVVLSIYMIMSPLMFLGWVFPALAKYSEMWWHGFLGRAFFAPVYLLMVYFAFVVLDQFVNLAQAPDYSGLFKNPGLSVANFGSTLPFFIMTCVFLIAAIVIAARMGADGASLAISFGKSAVGKAKVATKVAAGTVVIGGVGALGRQTAGRVGNALTSNRNIYGRNINAAAQGSGFKATLARGVQNVSSGASNSSFDARNVGGAGKSLGIGEGSKKNFKKNLDDKVKAEKARAKKYAYDDQAYIDYGVEQEFAEYKNLVNERKQLFNQVAKSDNNAEREALTEKAMAVENDIKAYEDGKVLNPNLYTTQDESDAKQKSMQKFKIAKNEAKTGYGQRVYASNLATRRSGIPIVGAEMFRAGNIEASEAIIKESKRPASERLLKDLVDKARKNDSSTSTETDSNSTTT